MMETTPDTEEVDIVIDGRNSTPESLQDTIDFINEYKKRPGYAAEVEESRRILEELKINSRDYCVPDPAALLEHWKKCVADLTGEERNGHSDGDLS